MDSDAGHEDADDPLAVARGATPMPPLADRVEAVLAELEPDVALVVARLDEHGSNRREVVAALGAGARASMRRHAVRIEQLARHMRGGAR